MSTAHQSLRGACSFVALLLLLSGCAISPVTGRPEFVLMTEHQEIELGRQYHQKILKQYRLYDDPELQDYVNRIGEALAEKCHRPQLIFRFIVLDSPEVNAFALPGGYIYITRGILAYLDSEAHLAGVLGHEIGHVTARHAVRQHAAATVTDMAGLVIAAEAGREVGRLSSILGTALLRGYGREHELQADRLGAEYLARVGYDPEEIIGVISVLKSQEEYEKQRAKEEGREARVYHGVFATHPKNDRRLQEVIQAAHEYDSASPRPSNRELYLRHIDGLVFGPGEQDGVLRGRHFYHKPLYFALSFPQDWKVENYSDRLIASPKDNGALIQLSLQDLNIRQTPEQFLRTHFDGGKLTKGREISTVDFEGYTGVTALNTPFGKKPTRVAVVFYGKRAFIFAGVSKDKTIPDINDRLFLDTIQSLHRLKEDELALAAPKRIQVITATPSDTFSQLARRSPITHHAEEELRLLNGSYPEGEPQPGQLIKIVE